jgi:hypothetical protein
MYRAMPAFEVPTGVVELAGPGEHGKVNYIVPLPTGDRVTTASDEGKVAVFAVATGALEFQFNAHEGGVRWRALAALGGDILVSGGEDDGKVLTWNVASGERLGEAAAGSGVGALAAVDGWRFVASTRGGDVLYYTHRGGRGVREATRFAGGHSDLVVDFAVFGGRLATASIDGTAAVWAVSSRHRLARLSGHKYSVRSVDMNDRLVATASIDRTVRVYDAAGDYSCTAVLDWLHTNCVNSLALIGHDHILSTSSDTVCVTQLSSSTVIARTRPSCTARCAATLPDGRLAVCRNESAALIDAPAAAADVLKAHGAAAFPEAATGPSALAIAEQLSPLQDSVVRVAAGEQTAAVACRDLISAEACSVSLAECAAAHSLLMLAVRDGGIAGDRRYKGVDFYWLQNLYLPFRGLSEGLGTDDVNDVKNMLLQAEKARVIQSADAMVVAIELHRDLTVNLNELRSAGEQILRAFAHIFMRQADMEQRLCDLENGYERFKRVQQWTQLANIVVSLIPFAGGSIACVIAGTAPAFEGMQISNVVESLLGVATVAQAAATSPLFNRFLSCGNDLLSEEGFAAMPAEARVLLAKVASELGVSMQGLRQILKVTAQRIAEVRDGGGPSVSVEVLGEDDEVDGRADAEGSTGSVNGSDMDDLGDRFEGATTHERLPDPVSYASENASPPNTACDTALAGGTGVDIRSVDKDLYQEAVAALLGAEARGTESRKFEDELHVLREYGVTVDLVSKMAYKELAVSLAAHMVEYEQVWLSQFVKLRARLAELFFEETVSGPLLVGNHAISPGEFLELVVNGLNAGDTCRPTLGQKAALRRFIPLVYGESG